MARVHTSDLLVKISGEYVENKNVFKHVYDMVQIIRILTKLFSKSMQVNTIHKTVCKSLNLVVFVILLLS